MMSMQLQEKFIALVIVRIQVSYYISVDVSDTSALIFYN